MGRSIDDVQKITMSLFAEIIDLDQPFEDGQMYSDINHILKWMSEQESWENTQSAGFSVLIPFVVSSFGLVIKLFRDNKAKASKLKTCQQEVENLRGELRVLKNNFTDLNNKVTQNSAAIEDFNTDRREAGHQD